MLEPPPPTNFQYNPYYEVADIYEPCDGNTNTPFGSAIVNITRGHGEGVLLSDLSSNKVVVSLTIIGWYCLLR